MDNRLAKIDFADPVKDASLFFSFLLICRVERNYVTFIRPRCQDSFKIAASKVASFGTNFVRIASTSEAKTSESGKADCLLAFVEDKKVSFMESPSFSGHSTIDSPLHNEALS